MEAECYRSGAAWMHPHGFGRMHLAKLADGIETPVFPVDIPPWLISRRKEVLEYLAETARASFPIPGYPQPLVRAHESANLRGLEMSVLGDMLVRAVIEQTGAVDAEQVVRHVLLGRGMVVGGTGEHG
jgi:NurA-like 5'-3' nuclease